MTSNSASTSSSTSKSLDAFNDLRNKRSLKLLEDSVKKLGKLSGQETNRMTSTYDLCQSKTVPFKVETFGSKGNAPNWITELHSCMSKYMQAHSCAAGAHNKSCEALKHGKSLSLKETHVSHICKSEMCQSQWSFHSRELFVRILKRSMHLITIDKFYSLSLP